MNALHPGFWILADPRYLREARKYNLEINSWTINDEPYIYMDLKLGIDAIITNYPDKVIKIRSKMLAK
jgi:glycerophosphoryl diester phosphodiesterase